MIGSADSKKYIVATDRPEPLITPGELQPISWGVSPLMGEDAFYLRWNGGGGFGDPLERDPAAVLVDVREGTVSLEAARDVYGVVLTDGAEAVDGQIKCGKCSHDFGPSNEVWKAAAVTRERPMKNAGGVAYHSRSHILLRTFVCPGCARLLATETTMENEPHLQNTLTTG